MKKEQAQISVDASEAATARNAAGVAANGEVMVAVIRAGQSYNEGLVLLGQEMLDFSRKRLSRDCATALSMARCQDMEEASSIHREWMRAATQEYATEMTKLFQLALTATADSWRPLQDHSRLLWVERGAHA